ncbi:hypothetical protein PEL8287_03170 [Roseovarius litorisediminis]|uniref:Uncharacterized protein n=1 Tax=Roseovarius litorisediminis TaxID=1312363 RepID=A0A1Y5TAB6_9RHOB|nr:hypothetical protein [Roseovarius litorisediminis]SLN58916.1 hypothetical protein PEL8287_03170 [Roseovarius litorisediminis]
MMTFLPPDVQAGLDAARKLAQKKSSRLRVQAGDQVFHILRTWDNGFALDADEAPGLRGLVDLYDGARLLSQCLIVASEEEAGEMRFEFKRTTEATGEQPLDFYREPNAPVALLPR